MELELELPTFFRNTVGIPLVASVARCEARFGGSLRFSPGVRLVEGSVIVVQQRVGNFRFDETFRTDYVSGRLSYRTNSGRQRSSRPDGLTT